MLSVACFYLSVMVSCVGKPAELKRPLIVQASWFKWENFIKSGPGTLFSV